MAEGDFGDVAFNIMGGEGGGLSDFSSRLSVPQDFGLTSATGGAGGGDAGGGFWSNLGSGLKSGLSGFGDVAKAILPAAQIGTAGFGVYQGIKGAQQSAAQTKLAERAGERQDQIAQTAQAQAAPIAEYGQEQLKRAGMGEVSPAQQASIDAWLQGAKQRINDQAARSGQAGSTQHTQWLAWADQEALRLKDAMIQGAQSGGLAAATTAGGLLNVGSSAAAGAGQNAAQQQGGIEQLIMQANQQLARLSAGAS